MTYCQSRNVQSQAAIGVKDFPGKPIVPSKPNRRGKDADTDFFLTFYVYNARRRLFLSRGETRKIFVNERLTFERERHARDLHDHKSLGEILEN
jgi:hypothetical protein